MGAIQNSDNRGNAIHNKSLTTNSRSSLKRSIVMYSLLGVLSIAILVIISALHGASFLNLGSLFGTGSAEKTLPIFTSPNNVYSCVNSTSPRISGMVYMPCVPQPSQTGDIVGFEGRRIL